jgi:methylase of polypeptide subunit release factors
MAWKENPLLPLVLRECRNLRSARLELKWLEEHAGETARRKKLNSSEHLLRQYCLARSRGIPLQYILGTEFFGELELECRPGVLIPR